MTAERHEQIRRMLSANVDDELTQGEQQSVRVHLEDCAGCRQEYEELARLAELTRALRFADPPDDRMKEIERILAVQAPRRQGWVFVLGGLAASVIYGIVMAVHHWRPPTAEELIAGAAGIGFMMLFGSVIVERVRPRPHDRYRRIEK